MTRGVGLKTRRGKSPGNRLDEFIGEADGSAPEGAPGVGRLLPGATFVKPAQSPGSATWNIGVEDVSTDALAGDSERFQSQKARRDCQLRSRGFDGVSNAVAKARRVSDDFCRDGVDSGIDPHRHLGDEAGVRLAQQRRRRVALPARMGSAMSEESATTADYCRQGTGNGSTNKSSVPKEAAANISDCGGDGSGGCDSSGGKGPTNVKVAGKAQSFRGVTWDKMKQVLRTRVNYIPDKKYRIFLERLMLYVANIR
jgi:hypothetical protein